jgi:hypothetical protein
MIYATTFASTMILRFVLYATTEREAGEEERMREDGKEMEYYDLDQTSGESAGAEAGRPPPRGKKLWKRLLISFSESFVLWQCRCVLYTGCALASVFGFVCFSDPIFACGILVASVELALVGATPWCSYEHEICAFIFVVSLLAAQVAACVVFLRVDPRYPFWVYGTLVGISLVLSVLFGLHPLVVAYARTVPISASSSSSKPTRYCLAWLERERLSWMEVLLGSTFVATFILVRGAQAP